MMIMMTVYISEHQNPTLPTEGPPNPSKTVEHKQRILNDYKTYQVFICSAKLTEKVTSNQRQES